MSSSTGDKKDDARSTTTTLSRNALYAPLVAYEQQDVEPSAYMAGRRNVPPSIKESSLVQFLTSISSLSSQGVDERIRQRGLTLVGGGINSTKRPKRKRPQKSLSNRQRKRILRRKRAATPDSDKKTSEQASEMAFDALQRVNEKWNEYARKVVQLDMNDSKKRELLRGDRFALTRHVSSILSNVELVGASAAIQQCDAHKQWTKKEGIIVGVTANTWRIALLRQRKQPTRVLVVPKHGSQISIRIPVQIESRALCVIIHGD